MLRLAVTLALFAGCLHAQSPGGLIGGIVHDAWSNAPLPRAVVTLSTTGSPVLDAVTYSGHNGIFGFTGVPPGDYSLCVEYSGYQRACLHATGPGQPLASLTLAAREKKNDIVLAMFPLGSVSGTVTGSDGDPLPQTSVMLLRAAYSRRTLQWQIAAQAVTNGRGQYHLSFVQPGQYRLMATRRFQPETHIRPDVTNGQNPVEEFDATQFYPHSDNINSAATLTLSAGNDLKAIDFSLTPVRQGLVKGRVIPPNGVDPNQVINLELIPVLPGMWSPQLGSEGMSAEPPDYIFESPPVPQGRYRLMANVESGGRSYRSSQIVEAAAGSEEISVSLTPGTPLAGHLHIEGLNAGTNPPDHVHLIWGEDVPLFGEPPQAEVQPDGSFLFDSVVPGVWDIAVEPRAPDSYLKSMTFGDQDVLREEMLLPPGDRPALNLVVSTDGAIIHGSVQLPVQQPGQSPDPSGQAAGRAMVLLAPEGKSRSVLSFYRVVESNAAGSFQFRGVTPGRYKIYAFDRLKRLEYADPNFLSPYANQGEAFDVAERANLDRKTTLIVRGPDGAP